MDYQEVLKRTSLNTEIQHCIDNKASEKNFFAFLENSIVSKVN